MGRQGIVIKFADLAAYSAACVPFYDRIELSGHFFE